MVIINFLLLLLIILIIIVGILADQYSNKQKQVLPNIIIDDNIYENIQINNEEFNLLNGLTGLTGLTGNNQEILPLPQVIYENEPLTNINNYIIREEPNDDSSEDEFPFEVRSESSGQDSLDLNNNQGDNWVRDYNNIQVINVASYSDLVIFLLENGNMVINKFKEFYNAIDNNIREISNNMEISQLTAFNGYLYGLGTNGNLYSLNNDSFDSNNWDWIQEQQGITGIINITSTLEFQHLWVQTSSTGYLFDNNNDIILSIDYPSTSIRIYGTNMNNYFDLENNIATVMPSGTATSNVYAGVLNYYNDLIYINTDDAYKYLGITIVDWNPYYLYRFNINNNNSM